MSTSDQIAEVCDGIKELLLSKNAKYGDSALNPTRVMSKANAVEQILVRIDDKLSRISSGAGLLATDEDVVEDIIGYFVLLKIALKRQQDTETKLCIDAYRDAAVYGYDNISLHGTTKSDWEDFWHNEDVVPNVRETPIGFEVTGNMAAQPVDLYSPKDTLSWDSDDSYMWDPSLGPVEPETANFSGRDLYDSPFS